MTRLEMQTQTFINLGQPASGTGARFTAADILENIERAQSVIAKKSRCTLSAFYTTTAAGTNCYSLPEPMLSLVMVEIDKDASDRRILQGLSHEQFAQVTYYDYNQQSTPEVYRMQYGRVGSDNSRPGDIDIWPIPDNNGGADYTLRVWVIKKPAALAADAEISELPEELHYAVTLYAAMITAAGDGDSLRYTSLRDMFQDEINEFRTTRNFRDISRTRLMGKIGNRSLRRHVGPRRDWVGYGW